MRIVAVKRKECFSPNSVENDTAILQAVADKIAQDGHEVTILPEERIEGQADVWLTMGRLSATIEYLKRQEDAGALVLNSGYGLERCSRSRLHELMRVHHIPMPEDVGSYGYWVKRGDAAAQLAQDVVYAADEAMLSRVKADFIARGIRDVVVSAHVPGDLVKFYGVGEDFFQTFYPTVDGMTKFGDERRNGAPHYYRYDQTALRTHAVRLASLIGIDIYGGDCIITPQGDFRIIDFNDWPSFSRCRREAADAIVRLVRRQTSKSE